MRFQLTMFTNIAKKYPRYLKKTEDVHTHDTRAKPTLYVPVRSGLLAAPKPLAAIANIYNALPCYLRLEPRYCQFTNSLHKFVYEQKFYDAESYFN